MPAGGEQPAGGLDAVHRGMRTSMSTTSGRSRSASCDRLAAVGGLADDLDVVMGAQDQAQPRADQCAGRRREHADRQSLSNAAAGRRAR